MQLQFSLFNSYVISPLGGFLYILGVKYFDTCIKYCKIGTFLAGIYNGIFPTKFVRTEIISNRLANNLIHGTADHNLKNKYITTNSTVPFKILQNIRKCTSMICNCIYNGGGKELAGGGMEQRNDSLQGEGWNREFIACRGRDGTEN